jgi:hypothetical protein
VCAAESSIPYLASPLSGRERKPKAWAFKLLGGLPSMTFDHPHLLEFDFRRESFCGIHDACLSQAHRDLVLGITLPTHQDKPSQ